MGTVDMTHGLLHTLTGTEDMAHGYLICTSCYLNFLTGSLTQNVYYGTFSNVNNEVIVTNVKKLKISLIFHY